MSWSNNNRGRSYSSRGSWLSSIAWFGIAFMVVAGLWWFAFGYYGDMTARQWKWLTQTFIERGFMPDGLDITQWTMWAYLFTSIFVALAAAVLWRIKPAGIATAVVAAVILVTSVLTWAHNLNDQSGSYAGSTTFVVSDTKQIPDSLTRLVDSADGKSDACEILADNDMPGCIAEGKMDFTWEARSASLVGATKRIKTASSGNNKTQLSEDTVTYVYGPTGEGSWTAIRDGKSRQPVYGVISYNGKSDPTVCKFTGPNRLDKAFAGNWGTNLSDEIASKYPNLFYASSDRYGYCDDDKPVIVIPVKEQLPYHHRTTYRSAGVLVITGSPTGDAKYQHLKNVKSGDFPGPVYPASLAKEQRESMSYIAGISNNWFNDFGYEPVSEESQKGNDSEYLLRNTDGRQYWVTPMKQRSGDNQRIVAYSVISADSASSGMLNDLQIFVLNDDDSRVASISDMEASVKQQISENYPGFYTAKGKLAEFLPLDDKSWQVYAEIGNRVVYRIVVPTDIDIKPTIYTVDSIQEGPNGEELPAKISACVEDLTTLSDKELAQCLSDIAEVVNSRQS